MMTAPKIRRVTNVPRKTRIKRLRRDKSPPAIMPTKPQT
jgi:hypothetical protein